MTPCSAPLEHSPLPSLPLPPRGGKVLLIEFFLSPAYWIAFGPHGPRALPPPGEGWKVLTYVAIGMVVSWVVFEFTRSLARPAPKTMTKEYQEQSNEYLKVSLDPQGSRQKPLTAGGTTLT
jgi:hypothetical protein